MDLLEIEEYVKSKLSEKRFYHSKCVMEMCEIYARQYHVDIEKAKKVGIAHDIAKELTKEEKIKYVKENNISIDEIEEQSKGLLHAKIGADIAKKQFQFDSQMVKAIEAHTTAKPKMDLLAKILFLADATGKDRNMENVEKIKKMAMQNIEEAMVYLINDLILERIEKKKTIHPDSIDARNEILIEKEGK